MKVSVITAFTPTPENRGGISALIYSLLAYKPDDVEIQLFSYNFNKIPNGEVLEISRDLNIEIHIVDVPRWYRWLSTSSSLVTALTIFLKRQLHTYIKPDCNIIRMINQNGSDFVWVYPYFFYNYAKMLPKMKFIVTGCDCISSVGSTRFADFFYIRSFKRSLRLFFSHRNSINVEEDFKQRNIIMHYVGMKDLLFYKELHCAENAFFLLHPHYRLKDKEIKFSSDKLKVLFAGRYDHYMECDTNAIVREIANYPTLKDKVRFTFLGKDWESVIARLERLGFECKHIKWVDDYAGELIQHDVQITPISNGGGTKGKVLDSIGNGLLTIGSVYALENICVRDQESCLLYRWANEVPAMLLSVVNYKERYEKIAEKGRAQVRVYHNPQRISKRFFEICNNIKLCI